MEMEEDQHFKLHRDEEDLPICPSFSSYSTNQFAHIAAKVAREVVVTRDAELGELLSMSIDEDSDLDFSFACCDDDYGTRDGEFRYAFPIFDGDLLRIREDRDHVSTTVDVSLKRLFLDEDEERDLPSSSSSSSSEVDELESIPPESYCVWRPREAEASPITCKKSRSTGSGSKRWKLRDLLYNNRSSSDGKSAFVFLKDKSKSGKVEISDDQRRNLADGFKKPKPKPKEKRASSAANGNMLLYSRNRAMKEGEKRKSYLPYRKDLIGFFTMDGIGRSLHHF